uniref:Lamina-associated polypeptide 2 alpha C-terminal domain-containing protein n=1 Tax=Xenopus tropicalis TaxID=8364 RepID=A0A1B8XUR9_XENTR
MEKADSLKDLREVIQSAKKQKKPDKLPKCKVCKHSLRKSERNYCTDCKPASQTPSVAEPPTLSPQASQAQDAASLPNTPQANSPLPPATDQPSIAEAPIPMPWEDNPLAHTSNQVPAQFGEFLQWIMNTVQPQGGQTKARDNRKRKATVTLPSSSESEEGLASDSEADDLLSQNSDFSTHSQPQSESDSDEEGTASASPETSKRLLREMMQTLEIKDETVPLSRADKLLGVQKKSKLAFPVFNSLTQAIEAEWAQPERRIALTQRFFKTYPVPEEHQKKWDKAPKVDSAVARLSRQTAIPAEEAAFKDPLDRRMESILKRSYTQAAAILRPAVASAGLARTARHWALELARHPPASKQQLQLEVDKLSTTLSFLAESALEITRLAAKATSNAVVARRALWLRHWSGDTASKMRSSRTGPGTPQIQRFLFQSVPGTKEGRILQTSPQLETTKPNGPKPKIQDGIRTISSSRYGTRDLHDDDRSTRRLLTHTNLPSITQIPQICNQQFTLPVHSTTLWAMYRTMNFYQGTCTNSGIPENPGSAHHTISGRPVNKSTHCTASSKGHQPVSSSPNTTRLVDQLPQKLPDSIPDDTISGPNFRLQDTESLPNPRQGQRISLDNSSLPNQTQNLSRGLSTPPGSHGINPGGNTIRQISPQTTTAQLPEVLEQEPPELTTRDPYYPDNQGQSSLVDGEQQPPTRKELDNRYLASGNHRCQPQRMGGSVQKPHTPRNLVQRGKPITNQCARTPSNRSSTRELVNNPTSSGSPSTIRQCNCSSLHQQTGRHTQQIGYAGGLQDTCLGRTHSTEHLSSLHTRGAELGSGLSEQNHNRPRGMVAQRRGLPTTPSQVGDAGDRHIGITTQRKTTTLLCQNERSKRGVCGRTSDTMGLQDGICIPATCHLTQGNQEIETVQHNHNADSPGLAEQTLTHLKWAENPTIQQFIRGVTRTRPPLREPLATWNLPLVLSALQQPPFEPLSSCELKWLSFKVTFLIAITSAKRVSEMAALSSKEPWLTLHHDKAVLRTSPGFLPKVVTERHMNQDIILPSFCPKPSNEKERLLHKLDVVRALRIYLKRSADYRQSESLLISYSSTQKGKTVSKRTIARWLVETIHTAYDRKNVPRPFAVKAHSTRAQSTSWALQNLATADQICRAATWVSPNTFIKFYKLNVYASQPAVFGRKVLQAAVA